MTTANPRAVFLLGFMGAGKTAVGRALAARLGCPFVDLDARVEAAAGRSIAELFANDGEAAFRRAELAALRQVIAELQGRPAVVALGGGAFLQPEIASVVRQTGTSVFLEAPLKVMRRRAEAAGKRRPLLGTPEEFAALYAARLPVYRTADLTVATRDRSAAEVAADIAARLGQVDPGSGRGEGDKR